MVATLVPFPTTVNPVSGNQTPVVSGTPTVPEVITPEVARKPADSLNTSTGTPLAQAQGANLQDVPGIRDLMNNLVSVINGREINGPDPRNGQFVVNIGDRQEAAMLRPGSPEGTSSVFHLVGTSGERLATFVVSWDSPQEIHTAVVRPGDSLTLTGVAPQDFGSASPSPELNQTLSALAAALPPRSSHPNPASLPAGSVVAYERGVDGGTLQIVQSEGQETATHNSTEITYRDLDGDEALYLQFARTKNGNFLIQEAYDMSGGPRKPPTAEQIDNVVSRLETLVANTTPIARPNPSTSPITVTPSPSPQPSHERRTFRDIFAGVPADRREALEQSVNLDESQMSFDQMRSEGILVYRNGDTVEFNIERITPETTRVGSDLASDYLRMVQSFQNLITGRLPGHVVTAVKIFPEPSYPVGSDFVITIRDPDGDSQEYNRETLDILLQGTGSPAPSNPAR
jgi:hypothetical protein